MMSVTVGGLAAAMIVFTVPTIALGNQLADLRLAQGAADAAALAAADAQLWQLRSDPCFLAGRVVEGNGFRLARCQCTSTECCISMAPLSWLPVDAPRARAGAVGENVSVRCVW
ncbi:MAG TPA: hypothetical protein VK139_05615 [Microbacteriaceae bacterium]|nr:hypothetical protein [Microbacteriaceae bacterium]